MDSDMAWIRPRPKMTEKQWNVYRRPISLVLNIGLIVKHYTTQCDKCIQKIVNAAEQLLYSQCFYSWPFEKTQDSQVKFELLGFSCPFEIEESIYIL